MSFQEALESGEHLLSIVYKAGMEGGVNFTEEETILEMDLKEISLALKDYIFSDAMDMYLGAKIFYGFTLLFQKKLELVKDIAKKAVSDIFDTKKKRSTKRPKSDHMDINLHDISINELMRLELVDLDDAPRDAPRLDEEPVVSVATVEDTAQSRPKIVKLTDQDIQQIEAEIEELAKTFYPNVSVPVLDRTSNVAMREPLSDIPKPEPFIQPSVEHFVDEVPIQPTVPDAGVQVPIPEIEMIDPQQQQLLEVPQVEPEPQQNTIRVRPAQHFIQRIERKQRLQNRVVDIPFYDFRENIVIDDYQGIDSAAVDYIRQILSREGCQTILSSFSLDRLSVSQDTRRLSSRPPSSMEGQERKTFPIQEEGPLIEEIEQQFVEEQIEMQPVQEMQPIEEMQPVQEIQELFDVEREQPSQHDIDLAPEERQQRIMNKIRDWNSDMDIKAEDLCDPPINRLNMARTFCDLIALFKGSFVALILAPGSLELDTIEKGQNFDEFAFV